MKQIATLVLAILLVVATLSPYSVGVVSADSIVAIDDEHGLNSPDSIKALDENGYAETSLDRLNMQISIAEAHEDVGLQGYHIDSNAKYLRLDYNEDVSRTVRLKFDKELFVPRLKQDLDAETNNARIDLKPSSDGEYTIASIQFDGETHAVFELSKSTGMLIAGRTTVREKVNESTGISLPSLGGFVSGGEWHIVPESSLSANTTYALNTSGQPITLQYDDSAQGTDERWIAVPECKDVAEQEVCQYSKDETVYVLSAQDDPPNTRWKLGNDASSGIWGIINDVRQTPSRILSDLDNIIPWR